MCSNVRHVAGTPQPRPARRYTAPTHLFFWMLFKIPVVPFTAGSMSSCGSVMLKWNGLAVCATASTPLTASSNTPSYAQPSLQPHSVTITHLRDVLGDDVLERLALEQVLQVLALVFRSDRSADLVAGFEQVTDDVTGGQLVLPRSRRDHCQLLRLQSIIDMS